MGNKLTKTLALALVFIFSIQTSGLADVTDLRQEGQFDGGDALLAFFAGVAAGSAPGPGKDLYRQFAATYIAPVIASQIVKALPVKNRWAKMVLQAGFSAGIGGAMKSGGAKGLSEEAAKEAAKDEVKKGVFRRMGEGISRNARALGRNTAQMGRDLATREAGKAFVSGFMQGAAYAAANRAISKAVDADKNPVLANFLSQAGAQLSCQFMGMALAKEGMLPQGQTADWKSFQKGFLESTAYSGSIALLQGLGLKEEYVISAGAGINYMINYAFNAGERRDTKAIEALGGKVDKLDADVVLLQKIKDGGATAVSELDPAGVEMKMLSNNEEGWGVVNADRSINQEQLEKVLAIKKQARGYARSEYAIRTMKLSDALIMATVRGVSSMLLSQLSLKTSSPMHGAYLNLALSSISATTLALLQNRIVSGDWGIYQVPKGEEDAEGDALIKRVVKLRGAAGIISHFYAQLGKDVAKARGDFMTMGQYQPSIDSSEEEPSGSLGAEQGKPNEAFFMPRYFDYAMTVYDSGFNEAMTGQVVNALHNVSVDNLSNILQATAAQLVAAAQFKLTLTMASPLVKPYYEKAGVAAGEIGESYGNVLAAQEQVLTDFTAAGLNDESVKALRALNEGKTITAEQAVLLEGLGVITAKRAENGTDIQVDEKGRAQVEAVNQEVLSARIQLAEDREIVKGVSSQAKYGPRLKGDLPFLEAGDPRRTLAGLEARGLDESNAMLISALVEERSRAGGWVIAFNVTADQADRLEKLEVATTQRDANGEVETDENGRARVTVNNEALDKKMHLVNLRVAIKSNIRLMGRAVERWHEVGRWRILEGSYTKAELGLTEGPYAVPPAIKAEALARKVAEEMAANADGNHLRAVAAAEVVAAGLNAQDIHAAEVSAATGRAETIADEMAAATFGSGKSAEEIRKDPRWQVEFNEAKASQMRGVRSTEQIRQEVRNNAYSQEVGNIENELRGRLEKQNLAKVDIVRGLVGTKRSYFSAWEELAPEPVPEVRVKITVPTRTVVYIGYLFAGAELTQAGREYLAQMAPRIKSGEITMSSILSNADAWRGLGSTKGRGDFDNVQLSQARADSAVNYLLSQGVEASQMSGTTASGDVYAKAALSDVPARAGDVPGGTPERNVTIVFYGFREIEVSQDDINSGKVDVSKVETTVSAVTLTSPYELRSVAVERGQTLSGIAASQGYRGSDERLIEVNREAYAKQGKTFNERAMMPGDVVYVPLEAGEASAPGTRTEASEVVYAPGKIESVTVIPGKSSFQVKPVNPLGIEAVPTPAQPAPSGVVTPTEPAALPRTEAVEPAPDVIAPQVPEPAVKPHAPAAEPQAPARPAFARTRSWVVPSSEPAPAGVTTSTEPAAPPRTEAGSAPERQQAQLVTEPKQATPEIVQQAKPVIVYPPAGTELKLTAPAPATLKPDSSATTIVQADTVSNKAFKGAMDKLSGGLADTSGTYPDTATALGQGAVQPKKIESVAPIIVAPVQSAPAVATAPAVADTGLVKPAKQFNPDAFLSKTQSAIEVRAIDGAKQELRRKVSEDIIYDETQRRMESPEIKDKITADYVNRAVAIAKARGLPEGMLPQYEINKIELERGDTGEERGARRNVAIFNYLVEKRGLSEEEADLMAGVYYRAEKNRVSRPEAFREQAYELGMESEGTLVTRQVSRDSAVQAQVEQAVEERFKANPALTQAAKDEARKGAEDLVGFMKGNKDSTPAVYEDARYRAMDYLERELRLPYEEAKAFVDSYLPEKEK